MSLIIFGKNLKYLRDKKKLTQEEIAGSIRIKTGTYSKYETGKAFPNVETLIDICNALDYFDLYRMLTVNLRSSRDSEKKALPANISVALKNIIKEASEVLNPVKQTG